MAFKILNEAWEVKGLKSSVKFVLVSLSDQANSEDFTCFPSIKFTAQRTGLSLSTVKRAIKELEQLGLISHVNRCYEDGNFASNLYTINVSLLKKVINIQS